MRILVYGFGPYRQFRDNITARIINSLPKSPTLRKVIFPVRFQRRQFIAALKRHRPDIILGLGQSTRATIEVESRARNRRRASKARPARPIFKGRPSFLPTTMKIAAGRSVGRSKDAGDYVCNYSMYVVLDEIEHRRMDVRFGFMHIPHDSNMKNAIAVIRKVLRQCRRAG